MKWLLTDPMPTFSLSDNNDLIYLMSFSICRATQISIDISLNTIGYTESLIWALYDILKKIFMLYIVKRKNFRKRWGQYVFVKIK